MKKLFIVRHAKAQKDQPGLRDFDRPLTDKGLADAGKAGDFLRNSGIGAFHIIASPAVRTAMTATIILEKLGSGKDSIRFFPEIYQAYPDTLTGLLRSVSDTVDCALLIGHNPGVHQLAEACTGVEIERFPTCTVAGLSFDVEHWSAIAYGKGHLFMLEFPDKGF